MLDEVTRVPRLDGLVDQRNRCSECADERQHERQGTDPSNRAPDLNSRAYMVCASFSRTALVRWRRQRRIRQPKKAPEPVKALSRNEMEGERTNRRTDQVGGGRVYWMPDGAVQV